MSAYRIVHRGRAWRDGFAPVLADPDAVLASGRAHVLPRANTRRVVAFVDVAGATLVLKLYREAGWIDVLEHLALGCEARRSLAGAERMQAAGFAVPAVVAVLETGGGLRPQRSCLVTEAVPGLPADRLWDELGADGRRALARDLGVYLAELHAAGLYPQDVRAGNLLVAGEPSRRSIVLVDLDRVRRYRRVSWRRRRKNLVQLERSLGRRAEAVHKRLFLEGYLGSNDEREIERVGAEILRASRRKDARSGAAP